MSLVLLILKNWGPRPLDQGSLLPETLQVEMRGLLNLTTVPGPPRSGGGGRTLWRLLCLIIGNFLILP